jgi:hypothetical protein
VNREHKQTYELMKRTSAISDRLQVRITSMIANRQNLKALDSHFDLAHKLHVLYMRLHQQYEDTKPQFLKDLWHQ